VFFGFVRRARKGSRERGLPPPPLAGEGWGGGRRDHLSDDFCDSTTVRHHIQIAEPNYTKSLRRKECVAATVASKALRLEMRAAIDFDHESGRMTNEVSNKGTDRNLPAERRAIQPMGAKNTPDDAFRVR
jgi:hypothetical protein